MATSGGNIDITTNDIDGDGTNDVVLAASDVFSVVIVHGDGAGKLVLPRSTPPTATPNALAIADLNGDGRADIANTSSYFATGVNVLLARADGSFAAPSSYTVSLTTFFDLTIADVTLDTKPDIVAVGSGSRVVVFSNRGDGTFNPGVSYFTTGGVAGIVAVDLNHDMRNDLVTSNPSVNGVDTVSVFLANPNGTFPATPATYPAGNGAGEPAVADFNNDGHVDIFVPCNGDQTVALLRGSANGTFSPASALSVAHRPSSLVVADFNSDGRADIVSTSNSIGEVDTMFLLNAGGGLFNSPASYSFGGYVSSVIALDIDMDGNLDLAAIARRTGGSFGGLFDELSILSNDGSGVFGGRRFFALTGSASSLTAGGLGGDSRPDLLIGNVPNSSTSPLSIYINRSSDRIGPIVSQARLHFESSEMTELSFYEPFDPLTVQGDDLLAINHTLGQLITADSVSTNAGNTIAIWRFASRLPDGNYQFRLAAGAISDESGNLSPDFTTSGLTFFILAADANRSRSVNLDDFTILAANFGQTGRVFSQGNFNYSPDGAVNLDDFTILASQFGKSLPPASDLPEAEGSGHSAEGGANWTNDAGVAPAATALWNGASRGQSAVTFTGARLIDALKGDEEQLIS